MPIDACFSMAGFEPERQVPLATASSLLRELAQVTPIGAELPSFFSASPAEVGALEPIRIFEAAHPWLATLQPVLLSLDDVQWADELSLALFHYLVRAAGYADDDMTLMAASRPASGAAAFASSLEQAATGRVVTIQLGPLSREEASSSTAGLHRASIQLPRARLGARPGSPFWIQALVGSEGDIDASSLVTRRLRGATATPRRCSRCSPLQVAR